MRRLGLFVCLCVFGLFGFILIVCLYVCVVFLGVILMKERQRQRENVYVFVVFFTKNKYVETNGKDEKNI